MADIVTTKRIIELPDASQDITENDYFAIDNENGDTGKIPANLFTSTSREAKLYDNTKTYAVGDHCIHQNKYYVCTTAIETPEVWTAAHWEQTDIGDEITELNNTLTDNTLQIPTAGANVTIDDGGYTVIGKLVIVNVRIITNASIGLDETLVSGLPAVKVRNSKNINPVLCNLTGYSMYMGFGGQIKTQTQIDSGKILLLHAVYMKS